MYSIYLKQLHTMYIESKQTIKDEIQLDFKLNKRQATLYSYFEKTS